MDPNNKPIAWEVLDLKTGKVVQRFYSHDQALAYCKIMESDERVAVHGYRYNMQPVRPHADA